MNEPFTTTELITPQMAQAMIDRSKASGFKNRKLSEKHVQLWAEEMKAGRWKLNGVSIRISPRGAIVDGNHRLHAVVKANVSVLFEVKYNVSEDFFDTYDIGKQRSMGDIISTQGFDKYKDFISSGSRAIYIYIAKNKIGISRVSKDWKVPYAILEPILKTYGDEIIDAASNINKNKLSRIFNQSVYICLYTIFGFINKDKRNIFFDKVIKGENDSRGTSTYALKTFLANQKLLVKTRKLKPDHEAKNIIHAWNKFLKNEPVIQLKINIEANFPDIIGFNRDKFIQSLSLSDELLPYFINKNN